MSPHSLNWPPPSWNTLIYRCGSHAAAKRANIIIMVKISQKIIMVKRERERERDGWSVYADDEEWNRGYMCKYQNMNHVQLFPFAV